jgi:hypothetical protein
VLFALHYEPERTSIPEGGEERSQLEQIAKIREFFPRDISIVVREHSSQLSPSLRGFMGRSPHFYAAVRAMDRTLLDHRTANSELLDHASWVVTGTGTIGIEAALRGIPVIHFGEPWWTGMPGTISFRELSRNPKIVSKPPRPNPEMVQEFLINRVTIEMLPGGASEDFEQLTRRFPSLTKEFMKESARAVGSFLNRQVNSDCD